MWMRVYKKLVPCSMQLYAHVLLLVLSRTAGCRHTLCRFLLLLPLLLPDASIWLFQFMRAMRDERGEMIKNAHLLGFIRRICRWAWQQQQQQPARFTRIA